MLKKLLTTTCLLFAFFTLMGQTAFEGSLKYELTYTGKFADQFAAFAPTGYEYWISGDKVRYKMIGGMAAAAMGDMLIDSKKGKVFIIRDSEKTYYELKKSKTDEEKKVDPEVKKLEETEDILGHTCQKYKVIADTEKGKVTQFVWTTADFNIPRPSDAEGGMKAGNIFIDGVEGVPLKIKTLIELMGMNVTMIQQATDVDGTPPLPTRFELPKGYKKKKISPEDLMGGM